MGEDVGEVASLEGGVQGCLGHDLLGDSGQSGDVGVGHLTREGDESPEWQVSLRGELLERTRIAHRRRTRRGDDHRLRAPAELRLHNLTEVRDDLRHLRGDVGGVQFDHAYERAGAGAHVDLVAVGLVGAFRSALRDAGCHVVRRVVAQHVEDESLLDRLFHRVQVEGVRLAVRARRAEELKGLRFRCCREGEEADAPVVVGVRRHRDEGILVGAGFVVDVDGFPEVEQVFDRLRGSAGLRRVRLVSDDREPLAREHAPLLADLLQRVREGLQRHADDGDTPRERFGELGRLRALGPAGDRLERARRGDELVDGILQLPVEHLPVGDDEHRVEDFLARGRVQGGEPVGGPRDRVGLARPRRMLDEVAVARSVGACRGGEGGDRAPLVKARKADLRTVGHFSRERIGLLLVVRVHELREDLQPRVAVEHVLPEVGGAGLLAVRRVAGASVVAAVEGQEGGRIADEPGRHRDVVLRERKMYECAAPGGQQGLALRVAVALILRDRSAQALREVRLELDRRHGDTVDEERQVEPVVLLRRVAQFGHDAQDVLPVQRRHRGVAIVGGRLLDHAEALGAHNVETLAQHRERAAAVLLVDAERCREPVEHARAPLRVGVAGDNLAQVLLVVECEPREHIVGVQRPLAVVAIGGADLPPVRREVRDDGCLELGLRDLRAHGYPSSSHRSAPSRPR